MSKSDIPRHIKSDVQKLAYDRTIESINRICDTFGRDPAILASAASASMNAAFLMLYCSTRLEHGAFPATTLYKIWGEAMDKEFEHMERGFDVAADISADLQTKASFRKEPGHA